MEIIYKTLDEIKPYEKNPRYNDEAVEYVANSIKEFGFKVPIVIDKNGVIVAGHTRYKASKQLGIDKVPCVVADDLNDEQIKAFRIADNKVSEKATWNILLLDLELSEIESIDMKLFDCDIQPEEKEIEVEVAEDNYEIELPEEPKAKRGYIYQLGDHVLMCGDSTKTEDVDKLMGETKADLIHTDPRYNVDLGAINKSKIKFAPERYKGANTDSIENDKMSDEAFIEFLTKAFENANSHLKEGRSFYIWQSCTMTLEFLLAMKNVGWKLRQQIIWNKSSLCLGLSDYQWKHEPCLYGWKDGAAHYFTKDRTQSTVIDDFTKLEDMSKKELIELINEININVPASVIDEQKPLKSKEHPTMKPIRLCAKVIKNSTKPGEVILDLFGGSGSTMIACEELGRKCYMMEYDPKYVDVIVNRWEKLTGEKAVLING